VFDETLQAVQQGANGVRAVILAGLDGMVVAATRAAADAPAADVLAASFAELYRKVGAAYRDAGLPAPDELTFGGEGTTVALRAVTPEYVLLALMGPPAFTGQVRFELRRAAGRLRPELL
jgi:predicted regulator of Ras-like GTPase activity (Roadblock/LC7/MglB family)